ncbi:MAG TPA: hypothetical protein VF739_00130 [Ktedonobacterales bacterium]
MLSKIAAVAHSKVALAVLGAVLVGGSGSAVALAATTGHLSVLGGAQAAGHGSNESPDSHAHTISVEGLLTGCSTTTPTTISVKDSAGKSWTFVVSATTKINGDTNSDANHSGSSSTGEGASSAKGDNSTHAGDNSANVGDSSANAGDSSAKAGDNSAHAAPTLAEVCASANIGTRDVQVQATQNGKTYDAWKVTLQGPESASSDGSSSSGASSHASGD